MAELQADCKRPGAPEASLCWISPERGPLDQNFLIPFASQMDAIMTSEPVRLFMEMLRRVQEYLVLLGAERRCAVRLDRVADRLASMGGRINQLRAHMHEGTVDEAIDADFLLRDALRGLKGDIGTIRCQLAGMRVADLSARMQRAFARLSTIASETYVSADRLQWEIADHDRRF
jgi:hypothetical protein